MGASGPRTRLPSAHQEPVSGHHAVRSGRCEGAPPAQAQSPGLPRAPGSGGAASKPRGGQRAPTPERTVRGLLKATAVTRRARSHVPRRVEGLVAALTAGWPVPAAGPRTCPGLMPRGRPVGRAASGSGGGGARSGRQAETSGQRRESSWLAWSHPSSQRGGGGGTSGLTGHRPSPTRLHQDGASLPVTSPPTRHKVMSFETGVI